MKIFLLMNCQYADTHVVSLHSTRELAEQAMAALLSPEWPEIEEMELDAPVVDRSKV